MIQRIADSASSSAAQSRTGAASFRSACTYIRAQSNQFFGEVGHYAFGTAVKARGNAFHEGSDLSNFHDSPLTLGELRTLRARGNANGASSTLVTAQSSIGCAPRQALSLGGTLTRRLPTPSSIASSTTPTNRTHRRQHAQAQGRRPSRARGFIAPKGSAEKRTGATGRTPPASIASWSNWRRCSGLGSPNSRFACIRTGGL